jgi:hypothetical protein
MDMMHNWALWRILIIGLIALPFLVAALVTGFRRSHVEGSISNAEHADRCASSEVSGPSAWSWEGDEPVDGHFVGAAAVERRAA